LRVAEDSILRRLFGPKRTEVTEGSRKVYNVQLHNLRTSLHQGDKIKGG
jgi:hypothetical protein